MFCSACGAEVRDTDSFCWKCGAKEGQPNAEATSAGATEKSSKVSRKTIFVGEDGTIHAKSPKIAARDAGVSAPATLVTRIDPSSYAGTWLDIHQAVLATGAEFDQLLFFEGNELLAYRLNPELFPFASENVLKMSSFNICVANAGSEPAATPEEIPQHLKADWIQLFLDKVDTGVDIATLVWMVRMVIGFVGFIPEEIQEGGEGNHELTDAMAEVFGVSGKTVSGKEAVRYFDKCHDEQDRTLLERVKLYLFGHIGYPVAAYKAVLEINANGIFVDTH